MLREEMEQLRYRRQYLLVPQPIECPFNYDEFRINDEYILYRHIDLVCDRYARGEVSLFLLGDIYDYADPDSGNREILQKIIHDDFNVLLKNLSKISGRYMLIFLKGKELYLVNDCIAARKIFYAEKEGKIWFSSQQHLLAKVTGFKPTVNPDKLKYYSSQEFIIMNNAGISNTTYYDEIFQLLPNKYFDVLRNKIIRFWPDRRIEKVDYREHVDECAKIIKGTIKSLSNRYEIMLPITSGKDSRLLFAGSKGVNRAYYYLNVMEHMNNKDLDVPQKLLKKLNLEFHLEDLKLGVDDDFRRVYYANNPLASEVFLPAIFNYYRKHSTKLNLPGNFPPTGVSHFKLRRKDYTGDFLMKLYGLDKYRYAARSYDDWLSSSREVCWESNINIIELFYWEDRLANWGTQIQTDKDISQEEVNPYASRYLSEIFFSVRYKDRLPPTIKFSRAVIHVLWPETLLMPVNPGFKINAKAFLDKYNFTGFLRYYRTKLI